MNNLLDEFRSTSITWDKATRRIYSPITANASDSNGRKLNIQVVNSGQVENLTGATLHLYWETKDKLHDGLDAFDASDISKGEFELFYTTGMLSNVGELNATLVLVDSTGKVVSDWFKITVTRGINEGAIQSENSFSSLTQALIDISNLEQNYAPRLNDLTAQLQHKIEKGENESITWGMIDQHFREQVTGGNTAVVGIDSVNTVNIVEKAVTLQKIDKSVDDLIGIVKYTPIWKIGQFQAGGINELAKVAMVDTQYYDLETDLNINFKNNGEMHFIVAYYTNDLIFTGVYTPYHEQSVSVPKQANRKVRISPKYKDNRIITEENRKILGEAITVYRNTDKSNEVINARLKKIEGGIDIPLYWQSHLTNKINTINNLQDEAGYEGTSFLFITDVHWNDNAQKSPELVKKVMEECQIPYLIDGGDLTANPLGVSKNKHIEELLSVKERLYLSGRVLRALGNHDDNSINNKYSMAVNDKELYNLLYRENLIQPNIVSGSTGAYHYVDNPVQKIRYIILNAIDIPYIEMSSDGLKYKGMENWVFRQNQIDWFADVALHTPSNDYSVVVCSHVPINQGLVVNDHIMMNILQAYQDGGVYSGSSSVGTDFEVTKSVDFTSNGGNVICWIAGHNHVDRFITMPEHITFNQVLTLNDSLNVQPQMPTKTRGTVTEQAFDVFTINKESRTVNITRVGAGSDRSFSY